MSGANNDTTRLSGGSLAGIVAGNVLEFYDFTVFAFFAVQIGSAIFATHPGDDGLLATLATFGVGFIARPAGAAIIGRYADAVGRKPAMILSFILMGGAMVLVALTPPASVLGVWSGVIIMVARLIQGFALGGEVGPTTALLIEAAPPQKRGLYGSWQMASQGLASLIAGLVGLVITATMSPQDVIDYGWRLALLLGTIVLPIGFYLRRRLPETLEAPQIVIEGDTRTPNVLKIVALGFLLISANTVTAYTLQFIGTYSITTLRLSPFIAFMMTSILGISLFIFALLGGYLSDVFGRRSILLVPRILLLVLAYPAFTAIVAGPTLASLGLTTLILTACFGMCTAAANVALAESLPRSARSFGYALTYTLAVSVFGGSAQFVIAWLIRDTGDKLVPAYAVLAASVIGIIAGMFIPVRQPRRSALPTVAGVA
jgi:MFS family permease